MTFAGWVRILGITKHGNQQTWKPNLSLSDWIIFSLFYIYHWNLEPLSLISPSKRRICEFINLDRRDMNVYLSVRQMPFTAKVQELRSRSTFVQRRAGFWSFWTLHRIFVLSGMVWKMFMLLFLGYIPKKYVGQAKQCFRYLAILVNHRVYGIFFYFYELSANAWLVFVKM